MHKIVKIQSAYIWDKVFTTSIYQGFSNKPSINIVIRMNFREHRIFSKYLLFETTKKCREKDPMEKKKY